MKTDDDGARDDAVICMPSAEKLHSALWLLANEWPGSGAVTNIGNHAPFGPVLVMVANISSPAISVGGVVTVPATQLPQVNEKVLPLVRRPA
jgi:hypothetical protein